MTSDLPAYDGPEMELDDEDAALAHAEELKQREREEYEHDMVEMFGNADAWNEWCKMMDEWYESMESGEEYKNG